jgi:hypothetical protein
MNRLIKTAIERHKKRENEIDAEIKKAEKLKKENALKSSKKLIDKFVKIFGKDFLDDVELEYDEKLLDSCLKIKDVEIRLYNSHILRSGAIGSEISEKELQLSALARYDSKGTDIYANPRSKYRPIESMSDLGSFIARYNTTCKSMERMIQREKENYE